MGLWQLPRRGNHWSSCEESKTRARERQADAAAAPKAGESKQRSKGTAQLAWVMQGTVSEDVFQLRTYCQHPTRLTCSNEDRDFQHVE